MFKPAFSICYRYWEENSNATLDHFDAQFSLGEHFKYIADYGHPLWDAWLTDAGDFYISDTKPLGFCISERLFLDPNGLSIDDLQLIDKSLAEIPASNLNEQEKILFSNCWPNGISLFDVAIYRAYRDFEKNKLIFENIRKRPHNDFVEYLQSTVGKIIPRQLDGGKEIIALLAVDDVFDCLRIPLSKEEYEQAISLQHIYAEIIANRRNYFETGEANTKKMVKELKRRLGDNANDDILWAMQNILDINNLSRPKTTKEIGTSLEREIFFLLSSNGFSCELTPDSGDFGVDILAMAHGKRFAIQAKNYEGSVGIEAIQQVHAGKTHYKCNGALVINCRSFDLI